MLLVFSLMFSMVAARGTCSYTTMCPNDPVSRQLLEVQNRTAGSISILTTSTGAPIHMDSIVTLNENLIHNMFFMDSLTHFVRSKIPERVVHAKGGGAAGYFEVTHNITHICKAKLFNRVGKRTPVATRFSPLLELSGGIDTSREPRGFAVKFYTEDGIFDINGLNTPIFFYNDPVFFFSFARAQKRNPVTNTRDVNTLWDIMTLRPEGLHGLLYVFGDRGIPDGYRHMPGFSIHTFQVVNDEGESHFVRFHFYPEAGIKSLFSEEAVEIAGKDADYANRDLYNAIAEGNFPSWSVEIQVLSLSDVQTAGFDVFDVTKELPLDKYPLRPLGRLVLNKNPSNYFDEVEQSAYCPGNLVPGILGAPDKLFEARQLAYREAQYYRLGANFNKIRVNRPISTINTYNRDGFAPLLHNEGGSPNYYPNSFNGPRSYKSGKTPKLLQISQEQPNNFDQAREMYIFGMSKDERCRLIKNIVSSLGCATKHLQDRAVKLFTIIHSDLGNRIQQGLSSNSDVVTKRVRC